jgi:hypothetical protein
MTIHAPFVDGNTALGNRIDASWLNSVNNFAGNLAGDGVDYPVTRTNVQDNLDIRTRTQLASTVGASYVGFLQGGTGAVLTTAQSKFQESISVFDFMTAAQIAAIKAGTSVTADQTAIGTAITAVLAAGGGELYFPPGVYNITAKIATITTSVGIRLRGAGARTVLYYTGANGSTLFGNPCFFRLQNCTNSVEICNMAFDLNNYGKEPTDERSTCAIDILNCINSRVANCRIINGQREAIVYSGCTGLDISNNYITATLQGSTTITALTGSSGMMLATPAFMTVTSGNVTTTLSEGLRVNLQNFNDATVAANARGVGMISLWNPVTQLPVSAGTFLIRRLASVVIFGASGGSGSNITYTVPNTAYAAIEAYKDTTSGTVYKDLVSVAYNGGIRSDLLFSVASISATLTATVVSVADNGSGKARLTTAAPHGYPVGTTVMATVGLLAGAGIPDLCYTATYVGASTLDLLSVNYVGTGTGTIGVYKITLAGSNDPSYTALTGGQLLYSIPSVNAGTLTTSGTVTGAVVGSSGRALLTINKDLESGSQITVAGVTGATGVNGTWYVQRMSSSTVELIDSVFGGTFSGAGTFTTNPTVTVNNRWQQQAIRSLASLGNNTSINITDNTIIGWGLLLTDASVRIENNVITNYTYGAGVALNYTPASNSVIANNIISYSAGQDINLTWPSGIETYCPATVIQGNSITRNAGNGIFNAGQYCNIVGNVCNDNGQYNRFGSGIVSGYTDVAANASSTIVAYNTLRDNGYGTQRYAYEESQQALTGIKVDRNEVLCAATYSSIAPVVTPANYSFSTTGSTQFTGYTIEKTSLLTVTTSGVLAVGQQSFLTAISGLVGVAGDFVEVKVLDDTLYTAGWQFTGQVDSVGNVIVRVINCTAAPAALGPASYTFKARLSQAKP